MSRLMRQLEEDRELRDAARELVRSDIAHLRGDLGTKRLGERAAKRIGEGATQVFDAASEVADSHRGVLVSIVGALVLWFARNPIIALLSDEEAEDADLLEDEADEQSEQSGQGAFFEEQAVEAIARHGQD